VPLPVKLFFINAVNDPSNFASKIGLPSIYVW
jgi:hypothetical protein